MSNEIILKKLEQIGKLLDDLERLLSKPFRDFENGTVNLRAAERNFQLIVDLASDINTQILLEKGEKTPDSYRQSFVIAGKIGALPGKLAEKLSISAGLRNVLVHEYDFEEDSKKFYDSAKVFAPAYRDYIKEIYKYAKSSS